MSKTLLNLHNESFKYMHFAQKKVLCKYESSALLSTKDSSGNQLVSSLNEGYPCRLHTKWRCLLNSSQCNPQSNTFLWEHRVQKLLLFEFAILCSRRLLNMRCFQKNQEIVVDDVVQQHHAHFECSQNYLNMEELWG